jgi:phage-related protein
MKPLKFVGSSLSDLRLFPSDATPGSRLRIVASATWVDAVRFQAVARCRTGAYEIRVHMSGEWRVIYVAKFVHGIYVLHAFQKKTRKTRKEDVELARKRYTQIKERP